MHNGGASAALIVALVAWGMYRRVRRTIGRQRLVARRLWVRSIILALVAVMFATIGVGHPMVWLAEALGLVVGIVFTLFVIRSTQFEVAGQDIFYQTNKWLGIAVVALFIGRLAYRFVKMYSMSGQLHQAAQNPATQNGFASMYGSDPWTAGFYYILCSYYIMFSIYLLLRRQHLRENQVG